MAPDLLRPEDETEKKKKKHVLTPGHVTNWTCGLKFTDVLLKNNPEPTEHLIVVQLEPQPAADRFCRRLQQVRRNQRRAAVSLACMQRRKDLSMLTGRKLCHGPDVLSK